jgi:tRNA-Thr(GGU) m(6)t(6)A37 methyltransferase TsaA
MTDETRPATWPQTSPQTWSVATIGTVTSSRDEAIDDDWGDVSATITLAAPLDERSVSGLEEFSHVEVVFLFDRVDPDAVCLHSRHPRGNLEWPEVGILAQRAKDRPNRIGLCTCELVAVDGATIVVRGLDAVDGTPVLDVKPYMLEFGPRGDVRQPAWSHELMRDYWSRG